MCWFYTYEDYRIFYGAIVSKFNTWSIKTVDEIAIYTRVKSKFSKCENRGKSVSFLDRRPVDCYKFPLRSRARSFCSVVRLCLASAFTEHTRKFALKRRISRYNAVRAKFLHIPAEQWTILRCPQNRRTLTTGAILIDSRPTTRQPQSIKRRYTPPLLLLLHAAACSGRVHSLAEKSASVGEREDSSWLPGFCWRTPITRLVAEYRSAQPTIELPPINPQKFKGRRNGFRLYISGRDETSCWYVDSGRRSISSRPGYSRRSKIFAIGRARISPSIPERTTTIIFAPFFEFTSQCARLG